MRKLETFFGIIAVLVLLVAAAVFGVSAYSTEADYTEETSSEQTEEEQEREETVSDAAKSSVYVIENDLDPTLEIGHVYTVSQKMNEDVSAFGTDGARHGHSLGDCHTAPLR